MRQVWSHGQELSSGLTLPSDPPFFRSSLLTAQQQQEVANLKLEIAQMESKLGEFRAGSINVPAMEQLLFFEAPLADERAIISNALDVASGHIIPWLGDPPAAAKLLSFRPPEFFLPQEADAIDKDVAEGLSNGTYLQVSEHQVSTALARRPVLQQGKYRIIDDARPLNQLMDAPKCSVQYEDLRWAKVMAAPFMSKLDLKKGYRQIPLASSSKPFFCFLWRGRLYQFQVMAFGDASAPQAFTTFMRGFALRWRRLGICCIIGKFVRPEWRSLTEPAPSPRREEHLPTPS